MFMHMHNSTDTCTLTHNNIIIHTRSILPQDMPIITTSTLVAPKEIFCFDTSYTGEVLLNALMCKG